MILDLIVVLVTGYGFYTGYQKGIIGTIFNILSIFIAILVSLKLSPTLISFLNKTFQMNAGLGFLIGFVASFFIAMMLIRFIGKKLEDVLEAVHVDFINKIAGGILKGFVYLLILSSLILMLGNLHLLPKDLQDKSITHSIVETLPDKSKGIIDAVKPLFSSFWDKTMETIEEIKDKGNS